MVRTKANAAGRKAVAEKAPRKVLGSSSGTPKAGGSGGSKSGKSKYSGGAPACQRPIPEWQKGIATFFPKSPQVQKDSEEDEPMAGGSSRVDEEMDHVEEKENIDANAGSDSEEAGSSSAGPSSSGSSQTASFAKNGIISDSDDDDE